MKTPHGHITYCSNVLPGSNWTQHFSYLRQSVPIIKKAVSPDQPMAIGLRLASEASLNLQHTDLFNAFKQWLKENDCYVGIMNGFPYGSFHETAVKDQVHAPDWLTPERGNYTRRLADILSRLLPDGMQGGISTSPLTYRYWYPEEEWPEIFKKCTYQLLDVLDRLIQIKQATGKIIHIDIEPEPDGLLQDGEEFLQWYKNYLLLLGIPYLAQKFGCAKSIAEQWIREHVQICYDVCHFAVNYESHAHYIDILQHEGIRVGRVQVSAALKAPFPTQQSKRLEVTEAFKPYNEEVYLHQVIALQNDKTLIRYPDLTEALNDAGNPSATEWRAHFHVPVFSEKYGLLQSTQQDIKEVLAKHMQTPFTQWLEVETYTWKVLPENQQLPLDESMIRELEWLKKNLS